MIVLYILLSVILLFAIVMLLPICIRVRCKDNLEIFISYGPITFKVFPNNKDKTSSESSLKKPKLSRNKHKKIKIALPSLNEVIDIVERLLKELKTFLMKMHFKKFNFNIVVSSDDAANAAITYGKVCSVCSTFYSLLESRMNPHNTDISVNLEYNSKVKLDMDIKLCTITLNVVLFVLKALFIAIPLLKNNTKKGEG